MADYEILPPGVINLAQPTDCTLQRGGHNPNPVQARLHFGAEDPIIGILESDGERVLLLTADGPIELCNHQPDRFLAFAEKHAGRRCRFASSMLSFTDGPTPAISVSEPDDLGVCRPADAPDRKA